MPDSHKDRLESFRLQLVSMRDELEARLNAITKEVTHADAPPEKDFAEQAVERENEEVLDALGSATREELIKIKRALVRLEQGKFGICVECGEPIQQGRLEAIPFSDLCIKCASNPNLSPE